MEEKDQRLNEKDQWLKEKDQQLKAKDQQLQKATNEASDIVTELVNVVKAGRAGPQKRGKQCCYSTLCDSTEILARFCNAIQALALA